MDTLRTDRDLDALFHRSREEPVVLYKHSRTCPVSAAARRQVADLDDLPVYTVVVQEAPAVSRRAAEVLDVVHETPQAIVVRDGAATAHFAHGRVTAAALREAIGAAA